MNTEHFLALRRQEPFRPFRVKTKDGEAFDAVHPELLMVCKQHLIIGFPRKGSDKPFFETFERINYSDVAEIEMLNANMALQTK